MNARPIAAVVLLLTFPASTFAQAPSAHLNLKAITIVTDEAKPARMALPNLKTPAPAFPQAAAPTQPCAESEARGRADADLKPLNKSWFYGGMAAGAVVGILGIGGSTAAAASVKPKPKKTPQ